MNTSLHVISGAFVGFVVGLTGIGGGALMTPILLLSGFPAPVVVGTDLVYAAITKAGGTAMHQSRGTIEWRIVLRLAAGSIPAAFLTIWTMHTCSFASRIYGDILTGYLGIMLIFTSVLLLFSYKVAQPSGHYAMTSKTPSHSALFTILMGALLGALVTLSSIGAGAFGTAILLLLYPHVAPARIVGTDLAHAAQLAFIAGFGHIMLDHVNYQLLTALLIGSLPATYFGVKMSRSLPDLILRRLLAVLLLLLGIRYTVLR